jgi:hypothetical protein
VTVFLGVALRGLAEIVQTGVREKIGLSDVSLYRPNYFFVLALIYCAV